MPEFIKVLVQQQNSELYDFNLGYIAGITVVVVILLLLLILRLLLAFIFRGRRCPGITISDPRGDVFISRTAVHTVIKSLEKEFRHFSIYKVALYGKKRHNIKIFINFDASGGGLPPQTTEFKGRVLDELKNTLGIDTINKVHVHLKNIKIGHADTSSIGNDATNIAFSDSDSQQPLDQETDSTKLI